jgi:hypothetical protein
MGQNLFQNLGFGYGLKIFPINGLSLKNSFVPDFGYSVRMIHYEKILIKNRLSTADE